MGRVVVDPNSKTQFEVSPQPDSNPTNNFRRTATRLEPEVLQPASRSESEMKGSCFNVIVEGIYSYTSNTNFIFYIEKWISQASEIKLFKLEK